MYNILIMQLNQQKNKESDDEFQLIKDQIETLHTQHQQTSPKSKLRKHPRIKNISEKHQLDLLITPSTDSSYSLTPSKQLSCVHGKIIKVGSVTFRSNFECGNIGTVEQIGSNIFKISLDLQSNSLRNNAWFYFSVQGMKGEGRFVIVGFSKRSSLYNEGMRICYRDIKESPKWRRGGTHISYGQSVLEGEEESKLYEFKFTHFFRSNQLSCVQFAASFPYGLTKLNSFILHIQPKVKLQTLGTTYDGRSIPVINVGNLNSKQVIVISARVHPGQTGSSFIMQGLIKQLLADFEHSIYLRSRYLFKIVPMINIDGVIRGNFRFSAPGLDLNRKWHQPSEDHHPEIYYLKQMILKQNRERRVIMYIDLHGHSRKKSVFFYGCCRKGQDPQTICKVKAFPYLMSELHEAYSFQNSSFNVQREKEGTARIAMWRELKINEVYTLEASFCGSQKGGNYLQGDLQNIGRKLCEGIGIYFYEAKSGMGSAQSAKMCMLKAKVMQDLLAYPSLLQSLDEYNSGSDSEPEKGQLPVNNMKTSKDGVKTQTKLVGNIKVKNMSRQKKFKHRSEVTIVDDKQYIKQKQVLEYLFQVPSQTLSSSDKKTEPALGFRNVRVHSLSRNNCYRPEGKLFTFNEQISMQAYSLEKNKTNLLMGSQGVQYRRVCKVAQQNSKKQLSGSVLQVQSVKGNHLQIENARLKIPKLAIYSQKSRNRRTSAQMFFKKANKQESRLFLEGPEWNVQCRGRQIMF